MALNISDQENLDVDSAIDSGEAEFVPSLQDQAVGRSASDRRQALSAVGFFDEFDQNSGDEFDIPPSQTVVQWGDKSADEAGAISMAMTGVDPIASADALLSTGDTSQLDAAQAEADASKSAVLNSAQEGVVVDDELDLDTKLLAVQGLEAEKSNPAKVEEEALARLLGSRETEDEEFNSNLSAYQESMLGVLSKVVEDDKELKRIINETASSENYTWDKFLADIGGAVLPHSSSVTTKRFIEEYLPSKVSSASFLVAGELDLAMREYGNSLSPSDRLDFAKDFNSFLSENSGYMGHNSLIKMQKWNSILGEHVSNFDSDENFDFERWTEDAISLLDNFAVGSMVKTGVKLVGRAFRTSSTAARMAEVNPDAMTELVAMAANGDATAQRVLGESSSDIIAKFVLPKMEGVDIEKLPESVRAIMQEAQKKTVDVANRSEDLVPLFRPGEVEDFAERTQLALRKVKGAEALHGSSTSRLVDGGVEYTATYGKSGTTGFSSTEKALAKARSLFPNAAVEVVSKTLSSPVINRAVKLVEKVTKVPSGKKLDVEALMPALKVAKEGKLSNLAEKTLRGDLRKVTSDLSKLRTDRSKARKGRSELFDEIRLLEQQRDTIKAKLDKQKEAAIAEANISRIEGGHLDKLQGIPSRFFIDETEDVVTAGEKVVAEAGQVDTTEYFFQVKNRYTMNADESLIFPEGSVFMGGKSAKYVLDPASRFADWISQSFERAFDVSKGIENELLSIVEKPFKALNNNDKTSLMQLLDKGNTDGKVLSIDNLRGKGYNPKVIDAYYAARRYFDALYVVNNNTLRRRLDSEGFRKLSIGDEFVTVGKGLKRDQVSARNIREVWDEASNSAIEVTSKQVSEIYENGGMIVQFRYADKGHIYGVVKNGAFKLDDLPDQVLKYRDGYVPRYYKDPYFIQAVGEVNGKRVLRAVSVAPDLKAANGIKDALQSSAEEGLEYIVRHERSLDPGDREFIGESFEFATGRMFFSERGDRLTDMQSMGLSDIADPVESMARAASTTARGAVYENLSSTFRQRFVNTYKEFLRGEVFPATIADIIKPADLAKQKEWKNAVAMYEHITTVTHAQDELADTWKSASVRVGDWLGEKGFSKSSNLSLWLGDHDPVSLARAWNFMTLVAMAPIRQLWLQTQQVLFLTGLKGATPYLASGKMSRDYLAMTFALTADRSGKLAEALPFLSKVSGIKQSDLADMTKAFKESGLTHTIDSNMMSRDAVVKMFDEVQKPGVANAFVYGGKQLVKAANAPIQGIKAVGFDAGEYNTLIGSWLVARNRWKLNNPAGVLTSADARAAVNGDARSFALSMTRPGSLRYQRGVLSLGTQFLAIQHKALLALIPKIGNKTITNEERARIAVGQLLMYGTSGWGLYELTDTIMDELQVELPAWGRDLIAGGTFELAVNSLLRNFFEEEGVNVSHAAAPGSGMVESVGKIIDSFFSGETAPYELMLGPTTTLRTRIGTLITEAQMLSNIEDPTTEDYKLLGQKFLSISSGYNNYSNSVIQKKIGEIVDKRGNKLADATPASAAFRGILGVRTIRESEFYDVIKDKKKLDDNLKDTAKTYYDRVNLLYATYVKDNPAGILEQHIEKLQEAIRMENTFINMHPADERAIIRSEFQRLVKMGERSSGIEALKDNLLNYTMNIGTSGDTADYYMSLAKRLGATEEEVQKVKLLLEHPWKTGEE